jgi:small conductance mechanosensitive channel
MEIDFSNLLPVIQFWGIKAFIALVIFFVGKLVARLICNAFAATLRRAHVEETLVRFGKNIAYTLLLVIVIISALTQLGISTASFVAVVGAAGLAVALALQGSLSNFAAGVMMIVFRPFKVGDFIEAAGSMGVIEEIAIFTTIMKTGDNRTIIIPNSKITDGSIINYSSNPTRRIDLVVGVSYQDDLNKVKSVLEAVLKEDERVLTDPAPTIGVSELADSSINFVVRPWVATEEYWPTRFDLNKKIKERFDAEGISIPFPQTDVHLYQVNKAPS